MSSVNSVISTVGPKMTVENPALDGIVNVYGPSGKLLHQVALSGDGNSARLVTKIGQRHYTIDIRQSPGPDTSSLGHPNGVD